MTTLELLRMAHVDEIAYRLDCLILPWMKSMADLDARIVYLQKPPSDEIGYCEALHELGHIYRPMPLPRHEGCTVRVIQQEAQAWRDAKAWAGRQWTPAMQARMVACLRSYSRNYGRPFYDVVI